jgi:hypothetical protein
MSTRWPPRREIRWDDTHRLIPDSRTHPAPILDGPLAELASATSRRALVQYGRIPSGIHNDELVFGVPEWPIVNAAFCYPNPLGARFSGPDRGAWYAGEVLETSIAEVAFHKTVELAETGWFELSITYADFLADIHGTFHDLRGPRSKRAEACLAPTSYVASQHLAAELLAQGSSGITYPSVRHDGGEAVACFRPAIVAHVRRGGRVRLSWSGRPEPRVQRLK